MDRLSELHQELHLAAVEALSASHPEATFFEIHNVDINKIIVDDQRFALCPTCLCRAVLEEKDCPFLCGSTELNTR